MAGLAALLTLLLGLQWVGLWHGVAHAVGRPAAVAPAAGEAVREGPTAPTGGHGERWGHRAGDLACALLDELAHPSPLALTPPALAPAPAEAAAPAAPAPASRSTPPPDFFDARGPPRA